MTRFNDKVSGLRDLVDTKNVLLGDGVFEHENFDLVKVWSPSVIFVEDEDFEPTSIEDAWLNVTVDYYKLSLLCQISIGDCIFAVNYFMSKKVIYPDGVPSKIADYHIKKQFNSFVEKVKS